MSGDSMADGEIPGATLDRDSDRLRLATKKLRLNFEELRQAGLIERADSRKLHSADDSREATIRAAEDCLRGNDGPLLKTARRLLQFFR
jgi:hypothetical protein